LELLYFNHPTSILIHLVKELSKGEFLLFEDLNDLLEHSELELFLMCVSFDLNEFSLIVSKNELFKFTLLDASIMVRVNVSICFKDVLVVEKNAKVLLKADLKVLDGDEACSRHVEEIKESLSFVRVMKHLACDGSHESYKRFLITCG
jgi:hypothetical protein